MEAGENADLRGVADAGGDFTGEHGGDEFIAAGLAEDQGCAGDELAAAGQENNIFQEFESAGASAVLIVDFAIDMIGVGEVDELGAGIEVAVVPAFEAHAGGRAGAGFGELGEIEEHELAGVEAEALIFERGIDGAAEGHELGFDAAELREGPHGEEHFFEEAASDGGLRKTGGDVQAADEAFLLFEDVEGIAGGGTVFKGHTAGESVSVEKALDEIESAAIVPVQLFAPVAGFFFEKRFDLPDRGLAQVEDIHGRMEIGATPAARNI